MNTDDRFHDIKIETPKGTSNFYRIDKYIFLSVVGILLLLAIGINFFYGFGAGTQPYVECKARTGDYCFNPFYNNSQVCGKNLPTDHFLCTHQSLPNGYTWGNKSPFIVNNFFMIAGGLLLGGLILNHLKHNKGKRLSE